ncbi:MAG: putative quinol monooxygenase [Candidatus Dormibacterales bacterium]
MLTVIAQYLAKHGKGDEIASTLALHVAATRTEPGCIQFVVSRSGKDPDRFVLFEQYVDEAAFDVHRASLHFDRYIENTVVPLLAERTWDVYTSIDPAPGR